MVDMFFYRDPEEVEKEAQEAAAAKLAAATSDEPAQGAGLDWDASAPLQPGLATEGRSKIIMLCFST